MSETFQVKSNEHGVIRIFTANLTPPFETGLTLLGQIALVVEGGGRLS